MDIRDYSRQDNICQMCGKKIIKAQQNKQEVKITNGSAYLFHSCDCANIFKKFQSVYGKDFLIEL
jgi:hypothetical protein